MLNTCLVQSAGWRRLAPGSQANTPEFRENTQSVSKNARHPKFQKKNEQFRASDAPSAVAGRHI